MRKSEALRLLMLAATQLQTDVLELSLAGRDGVAKRNARVRRLLGEVTRTRALPDDTVLDHDEVMGLVLGRKPANASRRERSADGA